MRVPILAASVLTLAVAAPAAAQHAPRAPMAGAPTRVIVQRGPMTRTVVAPRQQRWGGMVGGRWYAGQHAPGGWAAYRRPVRGWVMPRYWLAPSFYVQDWAGYGLRQPMAGHNWVRYYDDAVLVDGRGRVADSMSGIDWYGAEDVDAATYAQGDPHDDYAIGPDGEPPMAPVAGASYAPPPPPGRHDTGVGGALIGGAVGGVAGNLIAGRGNRLAGTLIGAGVGAIAGTAIDRAEDRGRRRLPPPPGAGYPPPGHGGGYAPYPPHHGGPVVHHGQPVYQGNGVTVVTTGSPYAYGATTTVVTVQGQPTTTTTTDYVWETVGHVRKHRRPVKRRCKC